MTSNIPPSSPIESTDTEDNISTLSHQSFATVRQEEDNESVSHPQHNLHRSNSFLVGTMAESDQEKTSYGTAVQRFSKDMMNTMSKYKVTEDLNDSNYPTWSQSVKEVFISMRLVNYIKIDKFSDPNLNEELNQVSSFNITTFILNRLDENNNTQTRNYLTDPNDPSEILYDPFKCWSFLRQRHNEISEDKLTAVTRALHECKILKTCQP